MIGISKVRFLAVQFVVHMSIHTKGVVMDKTDLMFRWDTKEVAPGLVMYAVRNGPNVGGGIALLVAEHPDNEVEWRVSTDFEELDDDGSTMTFAAGKADSVLNAQYAAEQYWFDHSIELIKVAVSATHVLFGVRNLGEFPKKIEVPNPLAEVARKLEEELRNATGDNDIGVEIARVFGIPVGDSNGDAEAKEIG